MADLSITGYLSDSGNSMARRQAICFMKISNHDLWIGSMGSGLSRCETESSTSYRREKRSFDVTSGVFLEDSPRLLVIDLPIVDYFGCAKAI